jgi:long-chain fatty acid transport protein
MYAPEKTISGPNYFDPTQKVELTMEQFELEVSYSWKR